jgi:hypothetical protein
MKNTIILRFVTFLLVTSMFMSCSKDGSLVSKQELSNTTVAAQQEGINKIPIVITTGDITGILSPVPDYAEIIVFKEDGLIKKILGRTVADNNGQFKIVDMPGGKCIMLIRYAMNNRNFSITAPVEVISGKVTDLGIILLSSLVGNK